MRKGREHCQYVGWRKDLIERAVAIKLRNAFLRLTMEQHLQDEITHYHKDKNKHTITELNSLNSEISYLKSKIESLSADIHSGKAKTYHHEMLLDMESEVKEKEAKHSILSNAITSLEFDDSHIESAKRDMHMIINLLDSDGANPQLLNQLLTKYIPRVTVERESKLLHLTIQFNWNEYLMYEKTIVIDFSNN